jgi:hypothetical protein
MTAMSWFGRVWETVCSHCGYYVWFVENQWSHMTPVKYATLLITIGLVGFLMMGRGNKRT